MAYTEITGLTMQYPKRAAAALADFSLAIEKGEFIAIVGPSGSGKSTLLNVLAGFEKQTAGTIAIAGRKVDQLPPKERDLALVFQEYALFPHMTVAENITFGMKIRKEGRARIQQQLAWVSEKLAISELLGEKPKQLSGGQRQRVALARAIVREPKLFLLDEPLSNLDVQLRDQVGQLILDIHRSLKATMLFVTHAQEEAMSLADRIVVLREGEIQQIGTPQEVYREPANVFTARFIGRPEINLLAAKVDSDGTLWLAETAAAAEAVKLAAEYCPAAAGQAVTVGIRSEDLLLVSANEAAQKPGQQPVWQGQLLQQTFLGAECLLTVAWQGQVLRIKAAAQQELLVGSELYFTVKSEQLLLFNENEERIKEGKQQ